jgi:succinate dehydrogenase/fumarate reductase flavoprotein subunit
MKGGSIDYPKYAIEGPETLPSSKMLEEGYKLPFYADLSLLPELERKAIWGLMVGEEGKTKVPIYGNYTEAGFDPEKDVLQCYGTGWTSASFLPQERQLFGLPGGFLNDWRLATNLEGLYVAGDSLYASNCFGHAAATGYYAGRHAAAYAETHEFVNVDSSQVNKEKQRVYAPLKNNPYTAIGWKELNMGISKTMQNYCGGTKRDELLNIGLERLNEYEAKVVPNTFAHNPHELTRLLEVFDILAVSQLIIHSCLARKTGSKPLCFDRGDSTEVDPPGDRKLITVKQADGQVVVSDVPLDFFGDLKENYEKYNMDYIGRNGNV